jgi:hypothetical protein
MPVALEPLDRHTRMTADFTISLPNDSTADADFVGLNASVDCRGFRGRTEFTISRRDLDRFLAEAAHLSDMSSDSAQLLGGWDDAEERLRLRITRAGVSGQFIARVRIATTGPREEQWNRVETEFICPSASLATFLTQLSQLVAQRRAAGASLAGDADAIA